MALIPEKAKIFESLCDKPLALHIKGGPSSKHSPPHSSLLNYPTSPSHSSTGLFNLAPYQTKPPHTIMARSRARAAPSSNQTRKASTMPAHQGPPPSRPQPHQQTQQQHSMAPAQQAPSGMAHPSNQPRQPGLFGQMASTAAGVAVGSTIGHTIGHGITASTS